MFAALAQRVAVLPSLTFAAGQQPPDDDAVTGLFCDTSVSAAGADPLAASATAPPSSAIEITAPPARAASALPRSFIYEPPLCKPLRRLSRRSRSLNPRWAPRWRATHRCSAMKTPNGTNGDRILR